MFKIIENGKDTVVDVNMPVWFMTGCILMGFFVTLFWYLFPPNIHPLLIFLLGIVIFFAIPCLLVIVICFIGAVVCLFFHELKTLLGGNHD